MAFICANCKGRHASVLESRNCHRYGQTVATAPPPLVRMATPRQLDFIRKLGGGKALASASGMTLQEASDYIDRLKKESAMSDPLNAPNRTKTIIPMDMLLNVPQGYYAVQKDDEAHRFYRVSRPKTGRFKGCFKVQSQHGENYQPVLTIFPSGRMTWFNMSAENDLLIVSVNFNACAIEYGMKIGRCCRCNKELTDERSRYFGIGPECEKNWPHIISLVEERKGVYTGA